jgi:hypothetical protein
LLGALGGIAVAAGLSTGAYFAYKGLNHQSPQAEQSRKIINKLIYTYTGHSSLSGNFSSDGPEWLAWTIEGRRIVSQGATTLRFWNALDGQKEVICTNEQNLLLNHLELEQNRFLPTPLYRIIQNADNKQLTV